MTRPIVVPDMALVLLIGASGAGKSSFAKRHFKPTEVISSDHCRALVCDDETDQSVTPAAFEILHFITKQRLSAGKVTVIDATNVQRESRRSLVTLARALHCLPVAIVFDLDAELCQQRNQERPERAFGPHVVRGQVAQLRRSLAGLKKEGFRHVFTLSSVAEVDAATVERQPLWNNKRDDHGPFDIIGDVHGCADELHALLTLLGYLPSPQGVFSHPDGRRALFLGDLVDRGPKIVEVLRTVMAMVGAGTALCVPGNHETKLLRKLDGRGVTMSHGLAETWDQLQTTDDAFRRSVAKFIDDRVSHYVLDDGKLVVAHAGLKESMQGRGSGAVREFCLYGEGTGETDEYGLPVRHDWADEYRGKAMVVYGHTPTLTAEWKNRTLCIDTGCVFGGSLTALRYPEREIVDVPAARVYYEPVKPLAPAARAAERRGDVLDAADVLGRRSLETRFSHRITIRDEVSVPALEIMSRFAVDPRWLIHLPPTMSPSECAKDGPFLEHPRESFAYFRGNGVTRVVCEEKHMGSRAIIVVCRTADAARARFGVDEGEIGSCYTRTGRPFFSDPDMQRALLARAAEALEKAGVWSELDTDWVCLDVEIMPWSAKAQELLRRQYAATGAVAIASLSAATRLLDATDAPGIEVLRARFSDRLGRALAFRDAYRRYCWAVDGLADIRVAPFHLLASEGAVHTSKNHLWHMEMLARLVAADPALFVATAHRVVDLDDPADEESATQWWLALTGRGAEGMVVKSLDYLVRGPRGLIQPAIKCRGPEYLRIIYGPEYDRPDQLERLRARGLSTKRSLASKELALGLEALHRFVERDSLFRVHECVFGVLALETEPVDPRL